MCFSKHRLILQDLIFAQITWKINCVCEHVLSLYFSGGDRFGEWGCKVTRGVASTPFTEKSKYAYRPKNSVTSEIDNKVERKQSLSQYLPKWMPKWTGQYWRFQTIVGHDSIGKLKQFVLCDFFAMIWTSQANVWLWMYLYFRFLTSSNFVMQFLAQEIYNKESAPNTNTYVFSASVPFFFSSVPSINSW